MSYRELQAKVKAMRANGLIGPVNLRAKKQKLETAYQEGCRKLAQGHPVRPQSTAIDAFGIDHLTLELWVRFKSGPKVYQYQGPGYVWALELACSGSVGKKWHQIKPKTQVAA